MKVCSALERKGRVRRAHLGERRVEVAVLAEGLDAPLGGIGRIEPASFCKVVIRHEYKDYLQYESIPTAAKEVYQNFTKYERTVQIWCPKRRIYAPKLRETLTKAYR